MAISFFGKLTRVSLMLIVSAVTIVSAQAPIGQISEIVGSILIKRSADSAWVKGRIKMPLYDKDAIRTKAESRCEISLVGSKVVRFGENALGLISAPSEGETTVKSAAGSVWINVKKLSTPSNVNIVSPTSTAAIRGTVFGVDCDTNGTNYTVFAGAVAVSSKTGKSGTNDSGFVVKPGEQFTLVKDLNLYMKNQEKAMADFLKSSQAAYDQFEQQQQGAFDKFEAEQKAKLASMVAAERAAFVSGGDFSYAKRSFDIEKSPKKAWILWNQEQDKKLSW